MSWLIAFLCLSGNYALDVVDMIEERRSFLPLAYRCLENTCGDYIVSRNDTAKAVGLAKQKQSTGFSRAKDSIQGSYM